MRLDVLFSPRELAPGELTDRAVLVIDVLRATSTMCAALFHGARAVLPTADAAGAMALAELLGSEDVVLAGERNCVRIAGFQLGNSPSEMVDSVVRGKNVVMSTTNGTGALLATAGAREVAVVAAVNLTAAADHARHLLADGDDLVILCAGREHGFGLDDAYIAGCVAVRALGGRRRRKGLNDGALAAVDLEGHYGDRTERVLALSRAGRELDARGFRQDVRDAAQVDRFPVLPFFHDRRVTLTRPASR
ncbi:MAG TPA: 2-phosphosulfolactate phosphatase [Gemmatimonadales bacterium]|jgi:2-phosphosulfolactate phosphatase